MSAETIVSNAMKGVTGAVAAGVVDMGSGMLLSVKTAESHPQEVLDILAPAAKELFEGDMVTSIENLFKKARGVDNADHYFREMLISSTNLWHYFGRLKSNEKVLLVVVAGAEVNMGMFLMKSRAICQAETV